MPLPLSITLYAFRLTRNIATDLPSANTTRSGKKATLRRTSSTGWTLGAVKMLTYQNVREPVWTKREYGICRARNAKSIWSRSTTMVCYAGRKTVNAYQHLLNGRIPWKVSFQSLMILRRHGATQPVVRKFPHPRVAQRVTRTSVWAVARMHLDTLTKNCMTRKV